MLSSQALRLRTLPETPSISFLNESKNDATPSSCNCVVTASKLIPSDGSFASAAFASASPDPIGHQSSMAGLWQWGIVTFGRAAGLPIDNPGLLFLQLGHLANR
jgi:hypothetical protein